jgi:hypothetical protein
VSVDCKISYLDVIINIKHNINVSASFAGGLYIFKLNAGRVIV